MPGCPPSVEVRTEAEVLAALLPQLCSCSDALTVGLPQLGSSSSIPAAVAPIAMLLQKRSHSRAPTAGLPQWWGSCEIWVGEQGLVFLPLFLPFCILVR